MLARLSINTSIQTNMAGALGRFCGGKLSRPWHALGWTAAVMILTTSVGCAPPVADVSARFPASSSQTQPSPEFLYVVDGSANVIDMYQIDLSTGGLTSLGS